MTDEHKTQQSIEQMLVGLPEVVENQDKTLEDLLGPMEEWIFDLEGHQLFLNPVARQWLFFDRVHKTWEPTGFGPGEVEFIVFQDQLGVRLTATQSSAAAGIPSDQEVNYLLAIESPEFPDPIALTGTKIIGRGSSSDIVVKDKLASRGHAKFVCSAGLLTIEDLGTTNGTRVNDVQIEEPTTLSEGDRISIGDLAMTIISEGT
jgi:hypothetical protein